VQKYKVLLLIALGSLTWIATMFKSGLYYSYGIGYWGPNGHDAIWHLSLINSLASSRFNLPMMAGEPLKNYHFGFDILTAALVRFTGLSASLWYFQILPVFFSLTIGFLVYKLTRSFWSVYFIYFATGLGWIVTVVRGQQLGGESMFWAQQAISTLLNPPFAISLIFLLLGFIYLQKRNYSLIILFFGLAGFMKIYAGILGLFSLFCISLYQKNLRLFLAFVVSGLITGLLFVPFYSLNSRTLIFQPFWFIQSMLFSPDRLYWPKLGSALINYQYTGNYIKLIPASLLALGIFIIGNIGFRLIGFIKFRSRFMPIIFLGLLVPVFYVQTGTTWNTIQFMYYSLFFLNLLAGIYFSRVKNYKWVIYCLILLFTLPAIPATLSQYLPSRPPAALSAGEISALKYLQSQPPGIVMVPLFGQEYFSKFTEPRPLFAYESTAYVSAYSRHPVFLEDEVNLRILNLDVNSRKQAITEIFTTHNPEVARKILRSNQITYLYFPDISLNKPSLNPSDFGYSQIYESKNIQIWRQSVQ